MKTKLVRIGNSKGIRLPKTILQQCGFEDIVELDVHDSSVVIRPAHAARGSWDKAFAEMAKHGDDSLLDSDSELSTEWDMAEWRW